MVITVDGYDGVGKTTLANSLSTELGFSYMGKPIIEMYKDFLPYSDIDIAVEHANSDMKNLTKDPETRAWFYGSALLWLAEKSLARNIILDRGLLSIYMYNGCSETEHIFDYLIENGAFFDLSLYLTVAPEERMRRIVERNIPNDPSLRHPAEWRNNNLEEYAKLRNLNVGWINTTNISKKEVLNKALTIVDQNIQRRSM